MRQIENLKLGLYYAGKSRITDKSLEILSRMTTLESLEFWQTAGITDAGVACSRRCRDSGRSRSMTRRG